MEKKITSSREKINKLNNKYKSVYRYKKVCLIFFAVFISLFSIFKLINYNKYFKINEDDIVNLNIDKFKKEVSSLYEREGEQDKFIATMEKLENNLAVYLIENTTVKERSFENLVIEVEDKLNSDDWSILNLNRNFYYSGEYIIDKKGNLFFKFNKQVEPLWAKKLNKYIVLN